MSAGKKTGKQPKRGRGRPPKPLSVEETHAQEFARRQPDDKSLGFWAKDAAVRARRITRIFNTHFCDPEWSVFTCLIMGYVAGVEAGKRFEYYEGKEITWGDVAAEYAPERMPVPSPTMEMIFRAGRFVNDVMAGRDNAGVISVLNPATEHGKFTTVETGPLQAQPLKARRLLPPLRPEGRFDGIAMNFPPDWFPKIIEKHPTTPPESRPELYKELVVGLDELKANQRKEVVYARKRQIQEIIICAELLFASRWAWKNTTEGMPDPKGYIFGRAIHDLSLRCAQSLGLERCNQKAEWACLEVLTYLLSRLNCRAPLDRLSLLLCRRRECTTPLFTWKMKPSQRTGSTWGMNTFPFLCSKCSKLRPNGRRLFEEAERQSRYARRKKALKAAEEIWKTPPEESS